MITFKATLKPSPLIRLSMLDFKLGACEEKEEAVEEVEEVVEAQEDTWDPRTVWYYFY